jgi:hypothetical protein
VGKVEIQKAGFPLSHRTDGLRRKEEIQKASTMCPVRCVYHVPVLTHTRVNAFQRSVRSLLMPSSSDARNRTLA